MVLIQSLTTTVRGVEACCLLLILHLAHALVVLKRELPFELLTDEGTKLLLAKCLVRAHIVDVLKKGLVLRLVRPILDRLAIHK